ncbi:Alpha/Beta hydrolase protein [Paraphoma chrysanthemicola]|uniref:Carboxylic ester hydrolase n=1 Tax=Paraphoma chrysanthemicola TaxID=798071 RepID=A0A8K0QXE7_9PLEO|nr:Alpha/Beta hydrolase protein [Paraphoma chrysanthemicola]
MRASNLWPLLASAVAVATSTFHVADNLDTIKYTGLRSGDIEYFLGIPYAQDTSGENRFKPPRPYIPVPGSTIDGTKRGPACPQPLGQLSPPLALVNITEVSENCLNLNIARPKLDQRAEKLPVMVWIHGGSFWYGSKDEPTTAPEGLIRQSVLNGAPVIHVSLNYRLGFFGFAQSHTLQCEGSENAGLRDQRLAIEWVRDHIATFGGDPENITILGQSSGGLAVGMQILAYGGTKPLPFQRGSAQSQSNEPGITANFTIDAMKALAQNVSCVSGDIHVPEVIACLRGKDTDTLLQASIATYASDIAHNIGDIWLPAVDGDFLPDAPSKLIAEGRFGKVTFMTGWAEDDMNFYTNTSISTAQDTYEFIRAYLPGLTETQLEDLLNLYPHDEFKPGVNLAPEFYRSARIFRDIIMVCPSLYYGRAVAAKHEEAVYHYSFNQTIAGPILDAMLNVSSLGPGHTSEFAYIFDTFKAYNSTEHPIHPTASDYQLMERASRSWSSFAATGDPTFLGAYSHNTVRGWSTAWEGDDEQGPYIMTIGGPNEKISAAGGPPEQKLVERCGFLNDPAIIAALAY